ncbi:MULTISPECIES: helix-turn-helix domain-containing protein [Priestia]
MHINYMEYNKIDMTKSQIQLIVQISKTGSFTKGGEELHMTQP